jgi:hypothetical protein
MATVDMTVGGVGNAAATSINHKARMGAQMPYTVEFTLDFAEATTAKGSALAAGDIFQVIDVPANTLLHGAIAECVVAVNSTLATVDIDVAAGDDFIDGGDAATTGFMAIGSNGLAPFGANTVAPASAADTIDVKLATVGDTAVATGKIRVIAFMTDVTAKLGPNEVDRDTLA